MYIVVFTAAATCHTIGGGCVRLFYCYFKYTAATHHQCFLDGHVANVDGSVAGSKDHHQEYR